MKTYEKTCYLCGGKGSLLHKGVRGNKDIDVLKCNHCGLVYLSEFISNTNEFYKNEGMRTHDDDKDSIRSIRINAEKDDERRFQFTKEVIASKRVLDFGCGAGGYLMRAREIASEVCGIELEKRMSSALNSEGIKCYDAIDDAESDSVEKFDIITLWHVLEHLEDPIGMLDRLERLLNPSGKIFIEVPNADDALLSLYSSDSFADFTYWECHLYLFNNQTIKEVIDRTQRLSILFQTQIQRYPLSNTMYWLAKGKPGGHKEWAMLSNENLDAEYGRQLATIGIADTMMIVVGK